MNSIKKVQVQKIKSVGDLPMPRFGHTFNALGQGKAVLFGGAVSDNGKFVITNNAYLYDLSNKRWNKINNAKGEIPSQRAAHASTAISINELAIHGGASGQQGLLKDDLYILDIKNPEEPIWKLLPIINKQQTPGNRYGHIMVYSKPNLIIFGGNSGSKTENDVWIINISKIPSTWFKCSFDNNKPIPSPRAYHSAALCMQGRGAGMIVVFGGRKDTKGRDDKDAALNDIWGLMRHSNGEWDWIQPLKTPNYTPIARYQHTVSFIGTNMIIVGGRSNPPQQNAPYLQTYDLQQSAWARATLNNVFEPIKRHRHASFVIGSNLVIYGGFGPENNCQPLESLLTCNLSNLLLGKIQIQNNNMNNMNIPQTPSRMGISRQLIIQPLQQGDRNVSNNSKIVKNRQRDLTPTRMLTSARAIKLSNQVLVAKDNFNKMKIQKVPVNNLLEQAKRLTIQPTFEDTYGQYEIAEEFLAALLPAQGQLKGNTTMFPFSRQKVMRLCKDMCKQLQSLPASVVYLRAPVKVFGSLYGRYYELLRLFQNFGNPDEREMQTFTYVFLGNYVDKGFNSLQTICLLMALKLKYPDHIVLLRGGHQDANVNKIFGFAQQCSIRMGENIIENNSVYNNINKMFQLLPLAAVIEDKLICVHSSTGTATSLQDIENIPRPLKINEDKRLLNMIWSGSENSFYQDIPIPSQIQVSSLLQKHGISTIIRSRQCLMDGVLQQGNTISIFSVANYGKLGNNSSILKITKNLSVVNQVLQPVASLRGGWLIDQSLKTSILFTQEQLEFRKKMFSPPRKK